MKENDELHRMLAEAGMGPGPPRPLPLEIGRRNSLTSFGDARACDRDYKRRKMDGLDDYTLSPPGSASTHHTHGDSLARPPPLTIPQSAGGLSHHYPTSASQATGGVSSTGGSGSLFGGPTGAPPGPFHIPNTPSGSSSTSSPPFSPAQMHASNSHSHPHSHSPVGHRPPSIPHGLSNYAQSQGQGSQNQYASVKAEDDNYSSAHHSTHSSSHSHSHSSHGYTLPPFSQTMPDHPMDNWHSYSSERAPLHR